MRNRHWFSPSFLAWSMVIIGVCLFCRLGLWQLHRAQEKEEILHAFASAPHQPAQEFSAAYKKLSSSNYPHARVRGRYDRVHSYLLDNVMRDGVVGIEVFSVFIPENEKKVLLINRGWLARPTNTRALPVIPEVSQEEMELQGLYAPLPGVGIRLGGKALMQQTKWPKLITYMDTDELSVDVGQPVFAGQLLLDKVSDPTPSLLREWKPAMMLPAKHRAYAFQWFAFAVASIVIFIVLHYRKST